MKSNRIREMLNQGKATLGTRVHSTYPGMAELVGVTGNFDYIEFPAEYMPFDQYDMENIVRASELHGMGSMMKIDFTNRFYVAQKAMGAGFQALLFADHKTPDEIRETIRYCKSDTPRSGGRYGYPGRRFIGYQPDLVQMDHAARLDETVLCFMIEKKEAMDNIEEICSIPGVDMVQFGPSDYSMSHGQNAREYMEECRAAERKMIEAAHKHGVAARCEIYGSPDAVHYYHELGVRHVCFGDELKIYNKFLREDGRKMKDMMQSWKQDFPGENE